MPSKEQLETELAAIKARSAAAWTEYSRLGDEIRPLKEQQEKALSDWACAENETRIHQIIIDRFYANS